MPTPTVKDFSKCPWTGNDFGYKSTNSGTYSNQSFDFSGGWKSQTDKVRNSYGGHYDKTQGVHDGKTGYFLEVVPNWDKLTWTSCHDGLDFGHCYRDYSGYGEGRPIHWTGYGLKDNGVSRITKWPDGCFMAGCVGSQNRLLCSHSYQMLPNSCPGYNDFNTKPYVIDKASNDASLGNSDEYYYNLPVNEYPRGKGKCFYPKNIITTDSELDRLLTMKDNNTIHPDLADDLAAEYCYSTAPTGSYCGQTIDGNNIGKCIKYRVDALAADGGSRPCTVWRNNKLGTTAGKSYLQGYATAWCEKSENKYTPLCDCLQRESRSATINIPIRNYYDTITNKVIATNTQTMLIPPNCWYKPCESNSYAIPDLTASESCTGNMNICNNIMLSTGGSTITDSTQYSKCTLNVTTNVIQGVTADDIARLVTGDVLNRPVVTGSSNTNSAIGGGSYAGGVALGSGSTVTTGSGGLGTAVSGQPSSGYVTGIPHAGGISVVDSSEFTTDIEQIRRRDESGNETSEVIERTRTTRGPVSGSSSLTTAENFGTSSMGDIFKKPSVVISIVLVIVSVLLLVLFKGSAAVASSAVASSAVASSAVASSASNVPIIQGEAVQGIPLKTV